MTMDSNPKDHDDDSDWIENHNNNADIDKKFYEYFFMSVFPVIKEVADQLEDANIPIIIKSHNDSKLALTIRADIDQTAIYMDGLVPIEVVRQARFEFEGRNFFVYLELYSWHALYEKYSLFSDSSKGFDIFDGQSSNLIEQPVDINSMLSLFKWLTYNTDVTPFDIDKPVTYEVKAYCQSCKNNFIVECKRCKEKVFVRTFVSDDPRYNSIEYKCVKCEEEMKMDTLFHACGFLGSFKRIFPGDCEEIRLS